MCDRAVAPIFAHMNIAAYIARRFSYRGSRSLSKLTVYMAVGSIALGLAVMEVSLSVTRGFQQHLTEKLVGFTGHLQVTYYLGQQDDSLHTLPLDDSLVAALPRLVPQVQSITPYIQKDAILKSPTGLEGIRTLGLAPGWDSSFFAGALVAGRLARWPATGIGTEVVLGRRLAQRLQVQPGSKLKIYFESNAKVRSRTVTVTGLYETGFAEFDQSVVLCHMGLLQRILHLQPNEVEGFSIRLKPGADAEALAPVVAEQLGHDQQVTSLKERHGDLFQWLQMTDQTLLIIIGLMVFVAVLNMAAALMILITEKTQAIGLLKALGATGGQVRGIFMWQAAGLLLRGMAIGNALALGLLLLQDTTGIVTLDAESYFLNEVAVAWPWLDFLWLNLMTLSICLLCMWLPTQVAQRLRIPRALRFR